MKSLKVVHVFLTLNMGGMETVGVNLIRELEKKGFKNYVICLDQKGDYADQLEQMGVSVWCANRKTKSHWGLVRILIRYIRSLQVDIVHTHNPAPNLWGGIAAFIAGIPIRVNTHHGINKNDLASKKRKWLSRLSMLFCTRTVAVSKTLAAQLKDECPLSRDKITTIYNGVDLRIFQQVKNAALKRRDLNIRDDEIIIGSVARFSSDKDYQTLIHAFDRLRGKGIAAKLLLVGEGDTRKMVEHQVADLTYAADILFLGQRTDITNLLSLFDIYVLSTHTEGVSISLLEAMAMQLPIVATAVGGNVEVIDNAVHGLLSESSNVESLTDSLMVLCSQQQKAEMYAQKARARVEGLFSLSSMADSYVQLYRQFLTQSSERNLRKI